MLKVFHFIIQGVGDLVVANQHVKASSIVFSNYLRGSTQLAERFSLEQTAEAEI